MSLPLLVVGGSGLVGSSIIRQSRQDHKYHILALSRSASASNDSDNVHYVQGNALEPSTLSGPLKNNPDVVCAVGIIREDPKRGNDGTFERVNRDSAITVAKAMAERYDGKTRKCFVFISAANYLPSFMLDRNYYKAKREAEAALLGKELSDRLRVVILQPGLIYSYNRRQLVLPFALSLIVGSAVLKPLSSHLPDQALYLTDRPLLDDDISKAVLEAVENKDVEGIYNIDRIRLLAKAWEQKHTNKTK
ncbi:hypothetical protein J3Q64DRAFT_1064109 [Phycomyces blakesleeanus]|uniref:NAD(P)-binding domain-containing protein n=2 Tax=Phycomyces blakesleeanus TaxID=4837 RepID=A0A163ELD0_PHYB8|nr:hypothetical protein PHYBLDRAFT_184727 [Phycomyces blakesleeanus NRRL 1555(-)]OAD79280.1 hypothetical protein PHYBLDRAFT_184727 [Phycomyces blakesleeanus NRRL 1555(-)]|eukprot:XP_018297320.1 hypothetical protein PHYBLDRAFT_184727 [Phycomyces blakesleeanus NRRL 1555(-)]